MIEVAVGIITERELVLLARRSVGKNFGGKWEFPGGKIEPGESPQDCLKREFSEEFDLDIKVEGFAGIIKHKYVTEDVMLHVFFARIVSGSAVLKVHDTLHWVSPDLLGNYDLLEADYPIAVMLQQRHSFVR